MNKQDRIRNMWTGLWVVLAVMLGLILLPFVIPMVTAVFSLALTVLIGGAMIYGIIIILTSVGSVINSNKSADTAPLFNQERVAEGKETWNKLRDRLAKWTWGLASKIAPKPKPAPNGPTGATTSGTIQCPECQGAGEIAGGTAGYTCDQCQGTGTVPIP